jgi:hypothetical protein
MSQLKIINTSQGYIHKYGNLKRKQCNYNSNSYFNQTCLKEHLIEKIVNLYDNFLKTQAEDGSRETSLNM